MDAAERRVTAREEYQACEARLVEVDRQIEALREWGKPRAYGWPPLKEKPHPGGHLPELLLERERLQAESFRLWQRMRAEVAG